MIKISQGYSPFNFHEMIQLFFWIVVKCLCFSNERTFHFILLFYLLFLFLSLSTDCWLLLPMNNIVNWSICGSAAERIEIFGECVRVNSWSIKRACIVLYWPKGFTAIEFSLIFYFVGSRYFFPFLFVFVFFFVTSNIKQWIVTQHEI